MRLLYSCAYLILFLALVNCNNNQIAEVNFPNQDSTKLLDEKLKFTAKQLEFFLDSVGALSAELLATKVSLVSDSLFKNQEKIDKTISLNDFNKLKLACKDEWLDIKTATTIFDDFKIADSAENATHIEFLSFDKVKNNFNEFAICLGYLNASNNCVLYFFKSNKLIAKHSIYHHNGLELKHYTDVDGNTIIYYLKNFDSGTGVWWYNFFFYKYYNNELIPILNELKNANLSHWGYRDLWLESFIQKTNPLTMKMVYHQTISNDKRDSSSVIVDDSTIVEYNWNNTTKTLFGNYKNSKITKSQILSYCLETSELLFINTHYKTLKNKLKNKDTRSLMLNYLNEMKNRFNN